MSLHWKMHTGFPFTRVFVLGIILFFLGLASMVISIIAFVQESWGYYVGTGMWGGALILASGLCAVFTSRLKSLMSVKAFLMGSVMGVFASLTMLILSAGGLTVSSGFYGKIDASQYEYNKRTSNLIHASLLVIAVFCLSGNVLAIIVSCKYLFFETCEKPPKHRRRHRNLVDGAMRTNTFLRGGAPQTSSTRSSNSRTVLLHVGPSSSRRLSDNAENTSSNSNRVPIEYRRSHRRAASDQPHVHSHSRRHRHGHECLQHHPSNMLSSIPSRCQDRRSNRSRSEEVSERMNIQPTRHALHRDPNYPVRMQVRLSNSPCSSGAPKVRLPTEFNEEELPPYEPAEASRVVVGASSSGESPGESGDESDTENSSSSDGHNSYDATPLCPEGTESLPMVVLTRPRRNIASQQNDHQISVTTSASVSNNRDSNRNRCVDRLSVQNSSRATTVAPYENAGSMIVRQDAQNSTRPVMSFVGTSSPSSQLGDYERLLSVSPEIRFITGASPEPNQINESHIPHDVEENFYENGPCYANIRQVGSNSTGEKANMENASVPKEEARSNPDGSKEKLPASDNPSARIVPVHVISPLVSSPPSSSIQSPRSSIGSNHSAFRPVGAVAVSPQSSHSICSPTPHSPFALFSDSRENSPFSSPRRKVPLSTMNETDAETLAERYKQQGARPKSFNSNRGQHNELSDETVKDNSNMSWKNIPLPLSYNHSECLCNEDEKLPPKSIPFADHGKPKISSISSDLCSHTAESSLDSEKTMTTKGSVPKSHSSLEVSSTAASSFGPNAEVIISPSNNSAKNSSPQQSVSSVQSSLPSSSATVTCNTSNASASKSTNTECPTVLSSLWPSHRMGGNQSLLQSRREALQNTHLSQRTLAGTVLLSGAGKKSPAFARNALERGHKPEGASSTVEETSQPRPLSLNGYLVNSPNLLEHQPAGRGTSSQTNQQSNRQRTQPSANDQALSGHNNLAGHAANPQPGGRQNGQANQQVARPNPFIHHYPIQPQQPRLGVQLQQRRQQQHQLQQNVELQQQQQLAAQVNQQNQPPAQQQPARNGRPLFSILL